MKKITLLLLFSLSHLLASFHASISTVSPALKQRMVGKSWHKGCPVPLADLRYLKVTHFDFQGRVRQGELVVHKDVVGEVVRIFEALYDIGYPIRQMRLVSDFGGNDWQSIEVDNTSAFNCRQATGSKKWSKHSYGKAIDINPIENPYISRSGHISHKASLKYAKRVRRGDRPNQRALLLKGDVSVQIFKSNGWKWGGDWHYLKDYQHFSKE